MDEKIKKEQIMINDVDVTNCIFLGCEKYCYATFYKDNLCKNNNCLLKQHACKVLECEQLKEENEKLRMELCNQCGEKDDYNISCRMIKKLDYGLHKQVEDIIDETKCEDYNNGCCKGDYYSSSVATTVSCDPKNMRCDFYVNKLEERLAHKMQEYEKLKSQVDEDYNYYTTELKTLRDIISNKEKRNAALFLTSGRYLKTLEDVERAVRDEMCDTLGRLCVYCDGKNSCITFKILDIINKAKEQE